MTKKKRILASVMSGFLAAMFSLFAVGCNSDNGGNDFSNYKYDRFDDDKYFTAETVDDSDWDGVLASAVNDGYETGTSRATQTAEYLGTVARTIPATVTDERSTYGVTNYPTWGVNLAVQGENLLGVIQESRALTPYPTWKSLNIFDAIDSEGYLLRNGEKVSDGKGGFKKLYKHTASVGMYGGDVSDDEPAVVKKLTYISRAGMASNQITGLYAPAGEVVKIEISQEELTAIGGKLIVYIGQNYNLDQQVSMEWNGDGANAKVKGSGFSRMSDILCKYEINSPVSYVGSFLGGPIYVRPSSNSVGRNFSVTISGAVKYQHFILGVTTPEEYELNKASSAPYFDLEIYDNALRFTTSKYAASGIALKDLTYQQCTDAAILWDKISLVSTRVQANGLTSSVVPVMAIGDCYIAAGAAFANPGRNGIVCPPSWLAGSLNYDAFVNGGNWGFIHEYNHCWQGFGVGSGGEVTNNSVSLVEYSLYTRISSARTLNWGEGGWNRFTDPSKALGELLSLSASGSKRTDLSLYATLLHNIGQENYVAAARGGRESGPTVYYNQLVNATHYDMTYYFNNILHFGTAATASMDALEKASVNAVKAQNYPMFVPVASVYQVGRSIIYDGEKHYITTAQPFKYGSGEYTMDFNDYNNFAKEEYNSTALVIPDGFTVNVVSVTQPENGTVELLENNMVKYTPNGEDVIYSGNFRVKLRITKNDKAFAVEDVDLVINLQQDNSKLQRTTYTYASADDVPDVTQVYNADNNSWDFGNSDWSETIDNVCTQESSCQIWGAGRNYYDDVYDANSTNYKELPVGQTIQTLDGVMYFSGEGVYRFALKGRGDVALYLSFDRGESYELAVHLDNSNGNTFFQDEDHLYDIHLSDSTNVVYFKAVLYVKNNWIDFFGIGCAVALINNEAPPVEDDDADSGDSVQATIGAFSSLQNANAYRDEDVYNESHQKFETEYFFTRNYTYTYTETYNTGTVVDHSVVAAGDANAIENMLDGSTATATQSNYVVSADAPWEVTVDLGKVITSNRFTMTGWLNNGASNQNQTPSSFAVYVGTTVDDLHEIASFENGAVSGITTTFGFDLQSFRYYKIVVTKTVQGRFMRISTVSFTYSSTGTQVAPNDFYVRYIGNSWSTENVLCNFGLIYKAQKDDYVEYRFNGTKVAYFAYQSADYGTVDIYIDGELVASDVDLSNPKNVGTLTFMSEELESGDHILKVVGKTGSFNVDSFVYWN